MKSPIHFYFFLKQRARTGFFPLRDGSEGFASWIGYGDFFSCFFFYVPPGKWFASVFFDQMARLGARLCFCTAGEFCFFSAAERSFFSP